MKTNNLDNFSDERIMNLLTPRFAPTTNLKFTVSAPRCRRLWGAVRIGSIAAMVALVIAISFSVVQTSTARGVVEQAIMRLAEADSYLVHFTARVAKSISSYDLYEIVDPDDAPMQGTVEIRKEDSKVKMAIKWQDDEQSMELYDGQTYRRYQNGQLVLQRPDKGIDLTPLASLEKLKPYAAAMGLLLKFREEGDTIIVSDRSDKVEIVARFSKSEGRLLGAECTTPDNVTVLSIDQIEFDVPPTE